MKITLFDIFKKGVKKRGAPGSLSEYMQSATATERLSLFNEAARAANKEQMRIVTLAKSRVAALDA